MILLRNTQLHRAQLPLEHVLWNINSHLKKMSHCLCVKTDMSPENYSLCGKGNISPLWERNVKKSRRCTHISSIYFLNWGLPFDRRGMRESSVCAGLCIHVCVCVCVCVWVCMCNAVDFSRGTTLVSWNWTRVKKHMWIIWQFMESKVPVPGRERVLPSVPDHLWESGLNRMRHCERGHADPSIFQLLWAAMLVA